MNHVARELKKKKKFEKIKNLILKNKKFGFYQHIYIFEQRALLYSLFGEK